MPWKPRTVLILLAALAAVAGVLICGVRGKSAGAEVVVYTSVDAEAALPLFQRFTKETGIEVTCRTDSEASKTTGMAERLLQLKQRPDGDVFWNSEQSFTQVLANGGALEPYASPSAKDIPDEFKDAQSRWTGFGARARALIYNTQKVQRDDVPKTLEGLADPRWKGRFVIAKPLYGTTRSHLVAMVLALGEERAFKLFRAWRDNGLILAESNSDVRNRVADGTCDLGLTDSDDVFSAMDRNKPVDFVVPGQTADWPGAFLIPHTVSVLKNCPRPKEARLFVDYLLRPETERWLAEQPARQIPVRDVGAKLPASLLDLRPARVDAARLADNVLPLGEKIYRVLLGEEK
ncbi:MAG: extracellular solute-binding protein [Planctomycetota bacterium]|nr:extracellular solute-binding protein [Planctomycetota bacterium]